MIWFMPMLGRGSDGVLPVLIIKTGCSASMAAMTEAKGLYAAANCFGLSATTAVLYVPEPCVSILLRPNGCARRAIGTLIIVMRLLILSD